MPSECDMSGLWRVRRGRCTGTVDLLICNSRNEDLIMKNEADIVQLPTVETFKSSVLLRDTSQHKV